MSDALVGVLAAVASVAAAVVGLWLGMRSLRTKEHQAFREDLAMLTDELADERHARLVAEAELHRAQLRLARLDDAAFTDAGGDRRAGGVGGAGDAGRDEPDQRGSDADADPDADDDGRWTAG